MGGSDFCRGAASAFYGAVHIALKLEAGVLAGEEEPAARSGEPGPEIRIERRIEISVAAARPRVGLPGGLVTADHIRLARAKPVEGPGEGADAVSGGDFLCGVACRAAC